MQYLLDTNIVSEIMKPEPDFNVICWMQDHNENLYLSAVSIHELYYGIYLLPDGKRKTGYLERLGAITQDCTDRIFPLDAFSGSLCGKLYADTRRNEQQGTIEDCMIAAICQRNNATLATRNIKDFEVFDIPLVNPFNYESETLKRLRREEAEHFNREKGEGSE